MVRFPRHLSLDPLDKLTARVGYAARKAWKAMPPNSAALVQTHALLTTLAGLRAARDPTDAVLVAVSSAVAERVPPVARALELHCELEKRAGVHHDKISAAIAHAYAHGLLQPEQHRDAEAVAHDGNVARHKRWPPADTVLSPPAPSQVVAAATPPAVTLTAERCEAEQNRLGQEHLEPTTPPPEGGDEQYSPVQAAQQAESSDHEPEEGQEPEHLQYVQAGQRFTLSPPQAEALRSARALLYASQVPCLFGDDGVLLAEPQPQPPPPAVADPPCSFVASSLFAAPGADLADVLRGRSSLFG